MVKRTQVHIVQESRTTSLAALAHGEPFALECWLAPVNASSNSTSAYPVAGVHTVELEGASHARRFISQLFMQNGLFSM